ncbi:NAD(P)/FAD-dependent oxidoreductase [Cohnella zeiphila]|uniref:NAD(P)/FAD-dependent oxidoreductase n=1 Tax=Cohnella zeiphila TaxID=2761120 RepID=UPI001EE2FAB7|nr:FAD-dependent oxidoreductase [Cohnella zeiphila]
MSFGSLYWPYTAETRLRPHPPLSRTDESTVLVVGGGMSGVICAYTLAKSGIDTILIERETVASGSTSANTGLIQYANDIMLSELADRIGETDAVRFYRACKDAIEHLVLLAETLPGDVGLKRRSSLYFASSEKDMPALRREFDMLDSHGFGTEWWDASDIASAFPFRKEGGIVTHGDAEINPFRFVTSLAEAAVAAGLRIYEHTPLVSVSGKKGSYVVRAGQGEIRAGRIVYAVGYTPEAAGGRWLRAKLHRSYAIVTKPLPSLASWHQRFMLWETARPYLYARTTADGRIIAGGLDENIRQPVGKASEVRQRSDRLLEEIRKLFPNLNPELEFEWCATFGESADGLPWLGEDPERPGQYYCLGYGGNGTVYSMIGAQLIRDLAIGADNPIAPIVRPDRPVVPATANSV